MDYDRQRKVFGLNPYEQDLTGFPEEVARADAQELRNTVEEACDRTTELRMVCFGEELDDIVEEERVLRGMLRVLLPYSERRAFTQIYEYLRTKA